MDYAQKLKEIFQQLLIENINTLVVEIDYYTEEKGFGIKGNTFNNEGLHLSYLDFDAEIVWNISDILIEWQNGIYEEQRWNKAIFTTYSDGHFEVKTWWDEDFQKELYPNG